MLRTRGSAADLSAPMGGAGRVELHELLPITSPDRPMGEAMQRAVQQRAAPCPPLAASLDGTSTRQKRGSMPLSPRRRKACMTVAPVAILLLCVVVTFMHRSAGGHREAASLGGMESVRRGHAEAPAPAEAGTTKVEFTAPGLWVPLKHALSLQFPVQPEEQAMLQGTLQAEPGGAAGSQAHGQFFRHGLQLDLAGSAGSGQDQGRDRSSGVRVLIGVASACCTKLSLERRAAIRRTWAALAKQRYPDGVDVKFFLAQPGDGETLQEWLPRLEAEAQKHNDTAVVRGADTYQELPNKTFRMFRYMVQHPTGYTHLLKTDDDTWVRMHRVMEALTGPQEGQKQQGRRGASDWTRRGAIMKAQLGDYSRQLNKAVVSDGMIMYDASLLVEEAEARDAKGGGRNGLMESTLDDIDGAPITLEQLAARRNGGAAAAAAATTGAEDAEAESDATPAGARMTGVYLGCIEVQAGFVPIRDPTSKWFVSREELPDEAVPWGVRYLAGWGYLVSRDLVQHVVQKVNLYQQAPEQAPAWFKLHWEDVLVGALLSDVVHRPATHRGFRPAWHSCSPDTAVRHLDFDSPRLLGGLMEQELSGLADQKPVQCSSAVFVPGDYNTWKMYKDNQK